MKTGSLELTIVDIVREIHKWLCRKIDSYVVRQIVMWKDRQLCGKIDS